MKTVKATREGLVGKTTASGYVVDTVVPFVALPSRRALGRFVRVKNPWNGVETLAIVLDVGPWNTHDDDYVFGDSQPQVEGHPTDESGRPDNNAGIDLGEKVWKKLQMKDNGPVSWEFVT